MGMTSDRSIFSSEIGSVLSWLRLVHPAPKSSSEIRMPSAASSRRTRSARTGSIMIAVSVTSRARSSGATS